MTSACAVGSFVEVTQFTPSAMISPALHDDGAKRPPARGAHVLNRKLDGARHEWIRHSTSISRVANFRGPKC